MRRAGSGYERGDGLDGEHGADYDQGDGHDHGSPGLPRWQSARAGAAAAANRQIRVADPVTSASTLSPTANTPRLWPSSPVITEMDPERTPKATEIETSHSAVVTCFNRAGPPSGNSLAASHLAPSDSAVGQVQQVSVRLAGGGRLADFCRGSSR